MASKDDVEMDQGQPITATTQRGAKQCVEEAFSALWDGDACARTNCRFHLHKRASGRADVSCQAPLFRGGASMTVHLQFTSTRSRSSRALFPATLHGRGHRHAGCEIPSRKHETGPDKRQQDH